MHEAPKRYEFGRQMFVQNTKNGSMKGCRFYDCFVFSGRRIMNFVPFPFSLSMSTVP
ncbi:hypothetical protein D068_cds32260 [Bacillus atrophaeus UCMB-5137]|nr:hypothetical protein D068_cds32260 [Bacillus atrophaeus UCMB-5137]